MVELEGGHIGRGLGVVHLPSRTPYVRKLHCEDFHIVNGTQLPSGDTVPTTVNADWLLAHRPLQWLDVLHLHHVEFEDIESLGRLLDACTADGIRVVFTAHDVEPMFTGEDELSARLRLLASADVRWIGLTPGSVSAVRELVDTPVPITVIPHGYVAAPEALADRQRTQQSQARRYLMFGASRPNRDFVSTLVNWSLGTADPDARLQLLLRAFSPADFADPNGRVAQLISAARSDPRVRLTMRPYPSDDEVIDAGLGADTVLLPYLWGSHSGQLELAFDLDLLPVCSDVGYLREQYEPHKGLVTEPEWFDWPRQNPYLFGEQFLAALERATDRPVSGVRHHNTDFIEHRRDEHQRIIAAHSRVYGGDP
ncbi:MAG: hypothetical protein ACRDT4_19190 [Micromonosporaceae bacterium]